jgi:hypothetical protein
METLMGFVGYEVLLKKNFPTFSLPFFFPLSQTYFFLVVFSYLVFLVAIFSSLPFFSC